MATLKGSSIVRNQEEHLRAGLRKVLGTEEPRVPARRRDPVRPSRDLVIYGPMSHQNWSVPGRRTETQPPSQRSEERRS